jgi:hypothetical protein
VGTERAPYVGVSIILQLANDCCKTRCKMDLNSFVYHCDASSSNVNC